jgi:hypothetical protein
MYRIQNMVCQSEELNHEELSWRSLKNLYRTKEELRELIKLSRKINKYNNKHKEKSS